MDWLSRTRIRTRINIPLPALICHPADVSDNLRGVVYRKRCVHQHGVVYGNVLVIHSRFTQKRHEYFISDAAVCARRLFARTVDTELVLAKV